MPQQRKITEEKIYIVRDCAEGKISCTEAAARCGVAFETMRRWVSRYCSTVTVYFSYSVFGNLYEIFEIARYAIREIKERT